MAEYYPQVLQKFANDLYSRARSQTIAWTILGFLVGAVAGGLIGDAVLREHAGNCVFWVALIAAVIGFGIGRERAFHLKLEAQRTLCQLQVEKNTRAKS